MKFLLFVEGHAERASLPSFIGSWLESRVSQRVGVKVVRFDGWADYRKGIARKVAVGIAGRPGRDVIGAIGLLDLYGPTFYPEGVTTADARRAWAKKDIEAAVDHPLFRQHLAVHELEAWLLAAPENLPPLVKGALSQTALATPEDVNFDEPPGHLLERLYYGKLRRHYKKTTDGHDLFSRLDPDAAAARCPSLKAMLEDMLQFAKAAGL